MDIEYNRDTREIEVTNDFGFPEYYRLDDLEIVDANERELGTEIEYLIGDNIHVVFYPEGALDCWYTD